MPTMSSMDSKVPLETKVNMDKDYDYYVAKYSSNSTNTNNSPSQSMNSQSPRHTNPPGKYHGNLGVMPMEPVMEQFPMGTPPRPPKAMSPSESRGASANSSSPEEKAEGDEALLDLAQLEELHHEAERMKALGNKHMAAQVRSRRSNTE
jgi:hypothetical protein